MEKNTPKETDNTPTEDPTTCWGCPRLSGDILKREEAKQTTINFYCLADASYGDKRYPMKSFVINSLSIDGKLPKPEEYPQRCESWRELRSVDTASQFKKPTNEDAGDIDTAEPDEE